MREALTEFLTVDRKNGYTFYIKSATEDFYIRRPEREYQAYQELRPYFLMPRARLAYVENNESLLVVRGVNAPSANLILEHNPERARETLESFISDNERMWRETARPMDESVLPRNWREETLKTIQRLSVEPKIQEIANLPMVVNGVEYPPIGQTLNEVESKLFSQRESVMALCHGDEHLGNIIPENGHYWTIDPGNWTGLNSPSTAVNNLVGANYLFFYKYNGEVRNGNKLEIDFEFRDESKKAEEMMRPSFRRVDEIATDILGGNSFAKEFLYINGMRVSMGWTCSPMDLKEVLDTGIIYAGVATEQYYGKEIV